MSGGGSRSDWTETRSPGSTGSSGAGGGGGGAPGADPCDIVSLTNLNSPNPALVGTLRPGDALAVDLQRGPPRVLQARTLSGDVVGSITSPEMPRIIQCILQGVVFAAEVVAVRGGVCQVRVVRR